MIDFLITLSFLQTYICRIMMNYFINFTVKRGHIPTNDVCSSEMLQTLLAREILNNLECMYTKIDKVT